MTVENINSRNSIRYKPNNTKYLGQTFFARLCARLCFVQNYLRSRSEKFKKHLENLKIPWEEIVVFSLPLIRYQTFLLLSVFA